MNCIRNRVARYKKMPTQSLVMKITEEDGVTYEPDCIDVMSCRPNMTTEDFIPYLTPSQQEIFNLSIEGNSTKQIATQKKRSFQRIYVLKRQIRKQFKSTI